MLEVKNLKKTFDTVKALNDVSFTVKNGVAFGLLGRNGAGKTTCIRIIMDIFGADSGEVLIDGIPSKKEIYHIGYLPEERGLYPKRTIFEQMVYIGELRGLSKNDARKSATDKLEMLEATEYKNRKLDTLSKGNQQKIQLAITLINNPDILILDEPFSGLDPVNAQLLKDIIRKQVDAKKTVIFSSHQMAQVEEFCDDICIIDKGDTVLSGNLDEIKKSYPRNNIRVVFEEGNVPSFEKAVRASSFIDRVEKSDDEYTVILKKPEDRSSLLRLIEEENLTPEVFSVIEPSLESIFIEKVGHEKEAAK